MCHELCAQQTVLHIFTQFVCHCSKFQESYRVTLIYVLAVAKLHIPHSYDVVRCKAIK